MFSTYQRLHVHVTASPREVIAAALLKLTRNARRGAAHRDARKAFLRDMLRHHREAQRIYQTWGF